jgi:hypothetical protein
MAGDWIKMRSDLADDPAVIGIATATGLDEFGVVGRLHKLWSWADSQTVDGNAASVTGALSIAWLDRYVCCAGFGEAMQAAGWLATQKHGLTFPNFDRHNGQTAKQRALASKRVARHRAKKCNADCNAPSVTKTLPEKRREEKRREEVDHTSIGSCLSNGNVIGSDKGGDPRKTAARLFKGSLAYADKDRPFLLAVARLLDEGLVAEDSVIDALEAVGRATKPIQNPVGYFRKVLRENVAADCGDLDELLAAVKREAAVC